jgi:hypothetical protein
VRREDFPWKLVATHPDRIVWTCSFDNQRCFFFGGVRRKAAVER